MSTNLRKAQKHMQRAEELLLNQNQFGFGVNREQRARNKEEEYPFSVKVQRYVEEGQYEKLQEMLDQRPHTLFHTKAMKETKQLNLESMPLKQAKTQMMKKIYPKKKRR